MAVIQHKNVAIQNVVQIAQLEMLYLYMQMNI